MPFDRRRKLVFLHIPKTAGSSIEQALLFGPWQGENLDTGFGLISAATCWLLSAICST